MSEQLPPTPPTPPPPPSGGGFSPPPPPPPPPVGGTGPYNAADAIGYGWTKFWKKPADILVPVIVVGIVVIIWAVIVEAVLTAIFGGGGIGEALLSAAISAFLVGVVANALAAGLAKSALNVVDGKPTSIGEIFTIASRTDVITTAVIVAALTGIGTLLCYVPVIVVTYLTYFTFYFLVDKGLTPSDAVKTSASFTTSRIGELILLAILGALVLFAGAILCGIGLLVAAPVVLIASAYSFRRLHGEPVVPAVAV